MFKREQQEPAILPALLESGALEVETAEKNINLVDSSKYVKIDSELGLIAQLPTVIASASMSGMYYVKFPEGISGTLMKLKQGGYGSPILGTDGKIAGHASFFKAGGQAALCGAFAVMAAASGQYFLKQINDRMSLINQKIDKVLGFLYGDKKAELLSEIIFVQRTIRDYASIMQCDEQRVATLTNIQGAEKVAMKDIEFYLQDLKNAVNSELNNDADVVSTSKTVIQICESLNASLQLYITSCILEIYYSQNAERSFIDNMKNDLFVYIDKCHSRMLEDVSVLKGKIESTKTKRQFDKQPILKALSDITDSLGQSKTRELQKTITSSLDRICRETRFIVTDRKELYCEVS